MQSISRKKRSITNVAMALLSQILTTLIGMLLPRALMINYGSETNGLITSMQQVISYLTLIDGGILSAVAVSLYKPIAEDDTTLVNKILSSAKQFYRKIGVIFCIALSSVAVIYPRIIAKTQFEYWEIAIMVLLIGVNGATQILFIGKYKALLIASQRNGIVLTINALSTVLYSLILILVSYFKISVIVGLMLAVTSYCARAVAFYLVVRRSFPKYDFNDHNSDIKFPHRKDALIVQILSMLIMNGGVLIMSILKAPMELLSVYSVYNLILSAVFMLMYSVENSVTSALGNLVAKESLMHIQKSYEKFDSAYHILWTWVVGCVAVLTIPFVKVYTKGIQDIQYVLQVESLLFICICALWMLRNQQTLLMTARGNFKDMRNHMSIEAIITIFGGMLLYKKFGLKGILIAKSFATLYSMVCFMEYNYNHILHMGIGQKLKRIFVSIFAIACLKIVAHVLNFGAVGVSIIHWGITASVTAVLAAVIIFVWWYIFLKNEINDVIDIIKGIIKRKLK